MIADPFFALGKRNETEYNARLAKPPFSGLREYCFELGILPTVQFSQTRDGHGF